MRASDVHLREIKNSVLEWRSMDRVTIKTHRKREILDITDRVEVVLRDQFAGRSGVCHLVVLHTTAALTTADLDPGTDADMLDAFEQIIPKLKYRHPHDPEHVPDHILSALIGTSVGLIVDRGSLVLGTWQRVILVELDGPRQREIAISFVAAV
jgi:secondary thiamine-phosphate synthase enzyme